MTFSLRLIQAQDNQPVELIIRAVLAEHGADRPGFAWQDPELSALCQAYSAPGHAYWVVSHGTQLLGGVGIAPLKPDLVQTCELQKMYLSPAGRGHGLGQLLLQTALEFAQQHYRWCYLETLTNMSDAASLYRKAGFMALPAPIISTEHSGCDRWFLKELGP